MRRLDKMKKMLYFVMVLFMGFPSLQASVFKGQRTYMKICKKCHKSGGKLAGSHTQNEWEDYFENEAKLLKEVHKNDATAMDKLNSDRFKKHMKDLREFFVKYASDTGNVPACN